MDKVMQNGGFIVDVPVTLSVAVRGAGLTPERAMAVARRFADGLAPTADHMSAFVEGDGPVATVTEATLESPSDEVCEILDTLEPEEDA